MCKHFIFFVISLFLIVNTTFAVKFSITNHPTGIRNCTKDTLVLRTTKSPSYTNIKWFDELSPSIILSNKDTFSVFGYATGPINIVATADSAGSFLVSDTITVTTLQSPTVKLLGGNILKCPKDSVTLRDTINIGTSFKYLWSNGSVNPIIKVTAAGFYTLTISGSGINPCKASGSKTISFYPSIAVNISGATKICRGDSVQLNTTITSAGTPPYFYNWINAANISNTGIANPKVYPKTTTLYKLIVSGSGSSVCNVDTSSILITVNSKININKLQSDTTICGTKSFNLKTSVNGGTPKQSGYQYSWRKNNISTVIGSNSNLNVFVDSSVVYKLTVRDSINCRADTNFTINVSKFTAKINQKPISQKCVNNEYDLKGTLLGGSTGPNFVWSPSVDFISNIGSDVKYKPLTTGVKRIFLTISDAGGCTSKDSADITVLSSPLLTTTTNFDSSCVNEVKTFNALPSLGSGVYPKYYILNNLSQIIDSSLSSTINIKSKEIQSNTLVNYFIVVQDNQNCKSSPSAISIFVKSSVFPKIIATDSNVFTNENKEIKINSIPNINHKWLFKDDQSIILNQETVFHTFVNEGAFWVIYTGTDSKGCVGSDSIKIISRKYIDEFKSIFIPSAFSPYSSNTENKTLKVYGKNIKEEDFIFKVFNQWGEEVYSTSSFSEANNIGWMGSINNSGSIQSRGIYSYITTGIYEDGTKLKKYGTVMLVR